ncbi:hypothetical protein [Christensenella timonensis]|uniref:hypothetical protein n=1 Tax=Christensenella timonensis TaxID=1816678 RepID=UPI0011CC5F17|nr:hypothetical protein [Christensenella timonensis]
MGKEQHSERDARIRRQEEERARQKREAERRRKEEERKRQEEEERKRRQQEAEERAKQAALEAAQSGWQPPQGEDKKTSTQAAQFGWQPPRGNDKKASLEAAQSGWQPPQGEDKKASTQAAQFGWQPPQGDDKKASTQAAQFGWQPPQGNDKKASTQAAQFGWQPPQMQKQAGEKEGAPQAQGKPYARTLMDNVLAHEGDTGDPFLMELNRDSWEQEYREGRIKAFKEAVGQLAGQLMSGEVKPAEGTDKQGNWTDGDLSDPFLQGLFGEEELKNEFVQGQMEQFMPALERRIAQLRDKVNPSSARRESPLGDKVNPSSATRQGESPQGERGRAGAEGPLGGKVSGQTEEPQQKDTAYGTNMVYTMDKDDKKASTEAAQSGWQPPQGNDKKASTEAAQFGWQPPQEPLPATLEGMRDYLKAHPNETIHGVNAAMLDDFEQQMDEAQNSGPQWTTSGAAEWNKACCSTVPGATLSENGEALIVDGRTYPINPSRPESNSEQIIEAPWETVGSYTQTNVSFDPAKGFAKMSLEGMDGDSGTDLGNGNVYEPKGSKASAGAEIVLNALGFVLDSVSSVDYTVTLLEKNKGTTDEKTQAIVEIATSEDRQKKANLKPGREYSLINDIAGIPGYKTADAENAAKSSYELYTGNTPDPNKQYDVVCTYSKEYLDNPTIGRLEQDKDGNVVCKPYLTGVKIEIVEYGGGKITKRIPLTDGTGHVFFGQRDSISIDKIS